MKLSLIISLVLVAFVMPADAASTAKTCADIEGRYYYDVQQIKTLMQNMIKAAGSDSVFGNAVKKNLKILTDGHATYPRIKSIHDDLKAIPRPSKAEPFYKNFVDQVDSAGQRVGEWKSTNTSGNTCNQQECKDFFNGCLLGYECVKTAKPQDCD